MPARSRAASRQWRCSPTASSERSRVQTRRLPSGSSNRKAHGSRNIPTGTLARDEHHALGNRIQVGLAAGSVVVEGTLKSASLSHANFCLRERRALFAVVPEGIPTQSQLPQSPVERGAQAIHSRHDYPTVLTALVKASEALAA